MDNNEFLKEQLDLIKKKQIDTSIEWQDVADFRSSHGKEPEHRDTIRKGSKLLLEYIDAGWDLFPSSSIQLGRFSDEIALKKERIKLQTEKQEFNKCLFENEKFENEKYYVIRAGYYYITSLLQLKHIKKFEKVIFQDDLIKLSKVRMFYKDFKNETIKNKYSMLVECLKRNSSVNDISIDDIQSILHEIEDMEI